MKTRSHDDNDRSPVPAPLSSDLELRPRGTSPASVRRALAPLIDRYVRDLVEATESLKRLAEEAQRANDRSAEAALRAKIVDQATAILRLCREEPDRTVEARPIRSQADVPRWDKLSPETRRKLDEAMDAAQREWGNPPGSDEGLEPTFGPWPPSPKGVSE